MVFHEQVHASSKAIVVSPNRTNFRDAALASGLVTRAQLDEAVESLRRATADVPAPLVEVTDSQLAEQLVAAGAVTSYQADQLKAGRTKLNLGPYTITDWIGRGGMGHVFKAVHKVMGREVAVKVLPRPRCTPESIANFIREIRAQAKLDHPNLVRAYDAGQDGNVHYLVTEYVPGADLRQLVRSGGRLDMQQAARVVIDAAHGLEYAHRSGLIHRDVKPGNLLVTPEGHTKVSDLGLAGFKDEGDTDPRAGKIVGTADYIAPEVFISPRSASAVSDVYSLGCTLYYAVTGKVPYPGGTTMDKQRRHREETPWHPRRFNPEVSEEFVEVIADMMEKDPHRRIQTAAEVAARLEPWAGEATPLAGRTPRSPWTMPPPPGVESKDDDGMQDTDPEFEELGIPPVHERESGSQAMQKTDPVASATQETDEAPAGPPPPPLPPLPQPEPEIRPFLSPPVLIALAVAVPTAMLVGALLTLALLRLIG